jgi:hypothetical protein
MVPQVLSPLLPLSFVFLLVALGVALRSQVLNNAQKPTAADHVGKRARSQETRLGRSQPRLSVRLFIHIIKIPI